MKKKIIILTIVVLFYIVIAGAILWLFSEQYNINGISHFLIITIDKNIPKTYIGELENHKVYIEELDIDNTVFRNINAENVSIKEVINKKLISIKELKKYSWHKFKQKDTETLRYENYEIVINNKEIIIRPISKIKSLDITCNKEDKYRISLKEGNTFDCRLLGTDYTFRIKSINKKNIVITSNEYGLAKEEDNTISLIDKEKEFTIEKNKQVKLATQSTDYSESIILEWQ